MFARIGCAILFSCLTMIEASAGTLPVPVVLQNPYGPNWCWAASSQAILTYTGTAPGMCKIVDWAAPKNGWGSQECCPGVTDANKASCDHANAMTGAAGSTDMVLNHWGITSDYKKTYLSLPDLQATIDDLSPMIIGWYWKTSTKTGGHAVVIRGYTGSSIEVMDPETSNFWEIEYKDILSYNYPLVTGLTMVWGDTLIARPKKVTFVVDDTGSMTDDIASVQTTLLGKIQENKNNGLFVKYTLITYKDDVTYRGTTIDPAEISNWISALYASGGGDCPEEGYGALDMAASKAPKSEIWWMTDAESHGGWTRMLSTRVGLLLAGNTLHSVTLGTCGTSAIVPPLAGNGLPDPHQDQQALSQFNLNNLPAASTPESSGDVNSYTAGQTLSSATGGLFFATLDLESATQIILKELEANSTLKRQTLPAGKNSTSFLVDSSISGLYIVLGLPAGATGTATLTNPSGKVLVAGTDYTQLSVDNSLLLMFGTAPATGQYKLDTTSDQASVLTISATSPHAIELTSRPSAAAAKSFTVKVRIPSLIPSSSQVGPGPNGPGGAMVTSTLAPTVLSFVPAKLQFSVVDEGGNSTGITLYNDGTHGDDGPGDDVYAGDITVPSSGVNRVRVTDGISFERETKVGISLSSVSVTTTDPGTAQQGDKVPVSFTVSNGSTVSKIFDITLASTSGWSSSAVPATLTLAAGAQSVITSNIQVPAVQASGASGTFTLTAADESDPSVFDSAWATIPVWNGVLLRSISSTLVSAGDQLTLTGSSFGADPGAGNRGSTTNNVSIAGIPVASTNVASWSDSAIVVQVPIDAVSGLVAVRANNVISNQLLLSVKSGFAFSSGTGGATASTVTAGQTATFTHYVVPSGGFNSSVALTCAVTPVVSAGPTCTLSATSVSVTSTSPVSFTVSAATTATTTAQLEQHSSGTIALALLPLLSLCFWKNKRRMFVILLFTTLAGSMALVSCGGGGSTPAKQTVPGTPAGDYTITVSGAAASVTHNATFIVTVK